MAIAFLTDGERERFLRFPAQIPRADINKFFTLSGSDRKRVPWTAAAPHRLGFALQLCALRYLGLGYERHRCRNLRLRSNMNGDSEAFRSPACFTHSDESDGAALLATAWIHYRPSPDRVA